MQEGGRAANLLGLDYRSEALRLGAPVVPIIDIHSHIAGGRATKIYAEAARLYGVSLTYSMTPLAQADTVREIMGDRVRFIAIPNWASGDPARAYRQGLIEDIKAFRERFDARILKFWNAPRWRDRAAGPEWDDVRELDSPWRVLAAEAARDLGMMSMVHIADPDTWFRTKYADAAKYGAKRDHYAPFERMLDRFDGPWIAAHMGGWPEDLGFLSRLLGDHDNLYLDCSATKWQVRELSRHAPGDVRAFFTKWNGRLLFGSDIVTTDDHLKSAKETAHPMAGLAASEAEAFDLYASRYWALRTLLETNYDGMSSIADPDLAMVEPEKYTEMSSPRLRGVSLPSDVLRSLYRGSSEGVFTKFGV